MPVNQRIKTEDTTIPEDGIATDGSDETTEVTAENPDETFIVGFDGERVSTADYDAENDVKPPVQY